MASIYDLKPRFQALLRPIIGTLVRLGVTPNAVTLTALAGSAAVGSTFYLHPAQPRWWLLPVWLFVRMALNAVDGMMAREHKMATHKGAILNELGDILSDIFLYLPLAVVAPGAADALVAFVLGAVLTEFCGVLSQALGGARRYQGPMGKSDRAFLLGALGLLFAITGLWPGLLRLILAVATLLEIWTCRNRL